MNRRTVALGFAALALGAFILAFHDLGKLALIDPDESRFAQTSREMMDRGDWIVPYFNGEPRLKKPPLINWMQIGAFEALGVSEFAARLPAALLYLGLLGMIVGFAWREKGAAVALRAGAIWASLPLAFACGRVGTTDMALAFFTTLGLFLYFWFDRLTTRWFDGLTTGWFDRRMLTTGTAASVGIGVALGFAVLAKGPVGLLAPLLAMAALHVARREWSRLFRWRGILLAGASACAIFLPWVIAVGARVGFANFYNVALRETVERYAGGGLEHPYGPHYYFIALPLVALPWSVFFVPVFVSGFSRFIRPAWSAALPAGRDSLMTFLWCWIGGMFVFFSISEGKLAAYMLPLLPAVALYLAIEWDRFRAGADREWKLAVALLAPIALAAFGVSWREVDDMGPFLDHAAPFILFAVVLAGGILVLSARTRRWAVVPLVASCCGGIYLLVLSIAGPAIDDSKSLRGMVGDLRGLGPQVRLAEYHDFDPSLVYYSRRIVAKLDRTADLANFLAQPGDAIVIMDSARFAALPEPVRGMLRQTAGRGKKLAFAKVTPVSAQR